MTAYELMTIYNINNGEDGARTTSNELKDTITNNGGKILDSDFWGKRKFAYPINKQEEGYYEVVSFEIDSAKVEILKKKYNLVNNLVRYLITASDA